jgi:hypothetical protein
MEPARIPAGSMHAGACCLPSAPSLLQRLAFVRLQAYTILARDINGVFVRLAAKDQCNVAPKQLAT